MEAPYAYVDLSPRMPQAPLLTLPCAEMTPTTEPHRAPTTAGSPANPAVARPLPMDTTGVSSTSVPVGTEDVIATGLDMDVDIELDQAQCSDLSSYVGSSAPFSPQSPAPTPGSEFP
ncbi:hypothetical protein PF002_g27385 [Phytophthora fragariae]|uniref:Uncharacterized protein n=1 Tax=Phytophthora fragariae TaxID=53985 RepID=A0A6A4BML6_9STRA|nr:hypothetical protein PF009_g27257 [Phytophthora fragariae]KAE9070787.1 hypothetical protein PF007_g26810 [Phytophthora fragariae]KAE9086620.1 hypothetical protein PF006_g25987 [Phytophthora fragariae]KAE9181061.1 hypothetical protein PF002_g27385 [Phytophthora fragariae]KAE9276812.1 hypothetical protein PF001_g25954 [Phytophthora fragariae]